jgi:hypothetical protein
MSDVEADLIHRPLTEAFAGLVRSLGGAFEDLASHACARCPSLPIPGANGIIDHGNDERPVAEAIAPMLEAIGMDGTTPWLVTFEGRRRVVEEAARLGLRGDHANAGMILEPRSFDPPPVPRGVDVAFPTDASALEAAGRLFAEAFDLPPALFAPLYEPADLRRVDLRIALVLDGTEPVSTAIAWPVGDAVGIFSVATPPRLRGRGFGAIATSAAVQAGFDGGATRAFLQASAMGEGIYRRLGFREVSRYLFLGPRGDGRRNSAD